ADVATRWVQARATTEVALNLAWVEKMRRDFLALMKNIPRVKDYETAEVLRKAFATYRERFNEFFFKQFLEESGDLVWSKAILANFRKIGWDFYIELNLPLQRPDAYYSEEARFMMFQQEAKAWEARLRTRAQVLWKELKSTLEAQTEKQFMVRVPTR